MLPTSVSIRACFPPELLAPLGTLGLLGPEAVQPVNAATKNQTAMSCQ